MTTGRAYDVVLIAPRVPPYGGMALQAELMEKLIRQDGMAVVFCPSNPPFPAALRWAERLPGLRSFVRFWLFTARLWRVAGQAEVAHILACSWVYFFLVVYPAATIARLRGAKVVLNYRGGEAPDFFRRFGWALGPVFRRSHVVSAPSGFLAELIEGRFHVPVRIVPNILDFSLFRYRRLAPIRPRLLVTRHLEKIYDVESVLRAFRDVRKEVPNASLWIAGSGSEAPRLRGLAEEWGLGEVRFLGHVAHGDIPRLFAECDILINASVVDNFPGALLEASAAGLVVVTTAAGGIPWIYRDGETALLVQPGDWRALASAVIKVLQDPRLADHLASSAAAMARDCEWPRVRERLYAAYGVAGAVSAAERGA